MSACVERCWYMYKNLLDFPVKLIQVGRIGHSRQIQVGILFELLFMPLNQSFHCSCNDLGPSIIQAGAAELTAHDSKVNLFTYQVACHCFAGNVEIEGI